MNGDTIPLGFFSYFGECVFLSTSKNKQGGLNIWPGFVDALTALVLVLMFVVLVFVISQYYLSSELSGRNKTVDTLSEEIRRLSLLLQKTKKTNAFLEKDNTRLKQEGEVALTSLNSLTAQHESTKGEAEALARNWQEAIEKNLSLEDQMAALQKQLQELGKLFELRSDALGQAESKNQSLEKELADLGGRLDEALHSKTAKLAQYKSEFFGRLREALSNRVDIKVVGDRFVLQSEVLFHSASADLEEAGKQHLVVLAASLKDISKSIPEDLNWILRVDGHTDKLPIHNNQFTSNWELSAARAISVVNFLIEQGIPPQRLAATGFGEFQPLARGQGGLTDLGKNRRIELKIDQR